MKFWLADRGGSGGKNWHVSLQAVEASKQICFRRKMCFEKLNITIVDVWGFGIKPVYLKVDCKVGICNKRVTTIKKSIVNK